MYWESQKLSLRFTIAPEVPRKITLKVAKTADAGLSTFGASPSYSGFFCPLRELKQQSGGKIQDIHAPVCTSFHEMNRNQNVSKDESTKPSNETGHDLF